MRKLLAYIYNIRFELFFVSLMLVMFGSLIMPTELFYDVFFSIFSLFNLLAGAALVLHNKRNLFIVKVFFLVVLVLVILQRTTDYDSFTSAKYILLALFYAFVSFELIRQVWKAKEVSGNIILGMMSGYICLGLLAFFAFVIIETSHPGSFSGIPADMDKFSKSHEIMNFSFITLLTVGYGDVAPVSQWAQKMSVLTALIGQFYMVIVTGVVIGKFLQKQQDDMMEE